MLNEPKYCSNCGSKLVKVDDSLYCEKCDKQLTDIDQLEQDKPCQKSKNTTIIANIMTVFFFIGLVFWVTVLGPCFGFFCAFAITDNENIQTLITLIMWAVFVIAPYIVLKICIKYKFLEIKIIMILIVCFLFLIVFLGLVFTCIAIYWFLLIR